jgi:hypothetical protein
LGRHSAQLRISFIFDRSRMWSRSWAGAVTELVKFSV